MVSLILKLLFELVAFAVSKILGFADTDIGKLAKLYLEEANTIKEIKTKTDTIFAPKSSSIDFENEVIKIKECLSSAPYIEDFKEFKN